MRILVITTTIFLISLLQAVESPTFDNSNINDLISSLRQMTWRNRNHVDIERQNFIKCGVPVLKQLAEASNNLDFDTKKRLGELGVRTSHTVPGFSRPKELEWHYDTGIFRIHYTLLGRHAVDSTDIGKNGIPDFVELIGKIAEETFAVEIGSYGYNRPPSDRWYSENGGTEAYDIYLLDIGETLFGYTQMENLANYLSGDNEFSDAKEEYGLTSYIAMNKDYSYFPCEETDCVKFTFAHEFFHAIQFGYDAWDEIWMLESSAVWMEDEVFDDVNDNYYYLDLWMKQPHIALNYNRSPHWYGSWIFFRYLSEHLGGASTIRKIFEQSVADISKGASNNSIHSIDAVLRNNGNSFRQSLNQMAIANYLLTSDQNAGKYRYEEGGDYRDYGIKPRLSKLVDLDSSGTIVEYTGSQLMHNATHYIGFNVPEEGAIQLTFESLGDSLRYQVNGIPGGKQDLTVYRIRGHTIIPISESSDNLTLVIVTDTVSYGNYHYRIDIDPNVIIPTNISILSNFPNPFNSVTTIRFFLPTWEDIGLSVVDLRGREVKQLKLGPVQAGYNEVILEARDLPSGPYLVKLKGETETVAKKIMLIK